jgi:hypothetical protein
MARFEFQARRAVRRAQRRAVEEMLAEQDALRPGLLDVMDRFVLSESSTALDEQVKQGLQTVTPQ